MARRKKNKDADQGRSPLNPTPPGATRRAFEHDLRPGEPPDDSGDPTAQGTPGGGTEVGGLAGTNIGDGSPENADLESTFAGPDRYDLEEDGPPYAGHSGGAVGGTPAEGRSSGGHVHGGLAPGAGSRGDSTIGSDPDRE
jgi:hypothetical protein